MKNKGVGEVIYAEGKTTEHLAEILKKMKDTENLLITRITVDQEKYIENEYQNVRINKVARTAVLNPKIEVKYQGKVLILSAGTSDINVADEAKELLLVAGVEVESIFDVGVAGIHRLFARLPKIRQADVIICIAGMEGALVSVVAGLTDVPVIGVPTSVGYGTSFKGVSALLTMLNSCSSGVTVVNIDNGFGAGFAAYEIIRTANKIIRRNNENTTL